MTKRQAAVVFGMRASSSDSCTGEWWKELHIEYSTGFLWIEYQTVPSGIAGAVNKHQKWDSPFHAAS